MKWNGKNTEGEQRGLVKKNKREPAGARLRKQHSCTNKRGPDAGSLAEGWLWGLLDTTALDRKNQERRRNLSVSASSVQMTDLAAFHKMPRSSFKKCFSDQQQQQQTYLYYLMYADLLPRSVSSQTQSDIHCPYSLW